MLSVEWILISLTVVIVIMAYINRYKNNRRQYMHVPDKSKIVKKLKDWDREDLVTDICDECSEYEDMTSEGVKVADMDEVDDGIDLYSTSYYGFNRIEGKEDDMKDILVKYGVGSCGPRAFYGTMDPHLELEQTVSDWMGVDSSILYSSLLSAQISIISALGSSKRKNKKKILILYHEDVSEGSKLGIRSSRSNSASFKTSKELKNMVIKQNKEEIIIYIEGIYYKTGKVVSNLREIVDTAKTYKCKIIMDDTYAVGMLGSEGRGTWEYYNLNVSDFYAIFFGLNAALGSSGAVCYSHHRDVIEFQRLNGSGYTFSASIPPYLPYNAMIAIKEIQEDLDSYRKPLLDVLGLFLCSIVCDDSLLKIEDNGDMYSNIYVSPILHLYIGENVECHDTHQLLRDIKHVLTIEYGVNVSILLPEDDKPPSLILIFKSYTDKDSIKDLYNILNKLIKNRSD